MTETPDYGLDNAWRSARDRLTALEEWLDPGTRRLLGAHGPRPGWACLEVGAGAGSIAAWLSERAEPDGTVLAHVADAVAAHEVVLARHGFDPHYGRRLDTELLATGLAAADLDRAGELCADPDFTFMSQITMAAWGRRPPGPRG